VSIKGYLRTICLFFTAFLIGAPLQFSDAANLQQVFLKTLRTNPDMHSAHANRLASEQALRRAKAGHFPTLDLRLGAGPEYSNNPTTRAVLGGDKGRTLFARESQVVAAQPIITGGKVSAEIAQARADLSSQDYELLATREQVALDTSLAYIDLLRYRRLYALARKNVSNHLRTLRKVRLRYRRGAGRRVDTELAISRLARARTQVIEVQREAQAVQARFKQVTGLSIPLRLAFPSFINMVKLPKTLTIADGLALKTNFSLSAKQNDAVSAGEKIHIAKSAFYPTIRAELLAQNDYETDGLLGKNQVFGGQLVLSYNLFNGGADQASVREAQQQYVASRADHSSAQRQVLQSLKTNWAALNAARAKIIRLSHYVRATRLVVKDYITQFTLGKRELFNVLDEETELFNAQTALANAQFDMLTETCRILADLSLLSDAMLVPGK
jgi:outer membrane protein, adhesin transport system